MTRPSFIIRSVTVLCFDGLPTPIIDCDPTTVVSCMRAVFFVQSKSAQTLIGMPTKKHANVYVGLCRLAVCSISRHTARLATVPSQRDSPRQERFFDCLTVLHLFTRYNW
jgi:hypothetical protein